MSLIFLGWLCISAVCDARYRKCFNWIVFSGLGLAIIYVTLIPELHLVNIDIKDSVFGGFLAFVVLLIFYALGMLGAGDVKFAAALGFWIGWKLLLPVWALSCAFAVAHGLFVRSNLRYFFVKWIPINSETQFKNKRFIPYVTYLSLATIIVLMLYK